MNIQYSAQTVFSWEVWGLEKDDLIMKFHLKFCKHILHCKTSTPTCSVYGELGELPPYIEIKCRILKYWASMLTKPDKLSSEASKVCFSPWYLVLSTLFVLTYHPCIISSLHINFTSLAIIFPISNKNYVSITYVTLKAPGSEKSISWVPHWANWLESSQQQTTDIVLSGNAKIIYNVL